AGVRDDLVLLVEYLGDGDEEFLLGPMHIAGVARRDRARGDDREEALLDARRIQRRLQVVHVALHLRAPGVRVLERADADVLPRVEGGGSRAVELLEA